MIRPAVKTGAAIGCVGCKEIAAFQPALFPEARGGLILHRSAQPGQRCAEIFLALPVEAFLVRAEARDARADFFLHFALHDRPPCGRIWRRFRRLDGLERCRCLDDGLDRRDGPWSDFGSFYRRRRETLDTGFELAEIDRSHARPDALVLLARN